MGPAVDAPRIGELGDREEVVCQLAERAAATIPFYAEHLGGHAADDVRALPTFSKHDLRGWGQHPLGEPRGHAGRYCATSGTTGPRLLVGFSANDWARVGDTLARRGRMVGLGPTDLVANTHGYGLWIGGPALDLLVQGAGAGLLPTGPGNTDQLIEWFTTMPITALSATPSFLRYLVERVDRADTDAWQVRIGLVGGEGASVELRRQVVDALGPGFRWQELYGSSEVGGPTLGWTPPEDPFGGRLLIDTDEFVVELLHPDHDEPVADGELGELTITTPWRETDPLIRYRTRDLARALPEVHDPSGYPSISTIVGRVDDALKVRGALVYPSALEAVIVAHCHEGAEWRIVVDREPGRLDTLTIVVEHDDRVAGGLGEAIHHEVAVRPIVEVVAPGSLDRFEGKAQRLVDRR